ncbi:hypothetical protein ACWGBV_04440 [Streptomyces sp. NPDC055051]
MSEWTREGPVAAPFYDRADPRSGRTLVNFHLRELGLGESWLIRADADGQRFCRHVVPRDVGVRRAYVLTEAAWPEGAEDHWHECLDRLHQALSGSGFVLRSRSRPCSQADDSADLLVYRAAAPLSTSE